MAKLDSFIDTIAVDEEFILEMNREPCVRVDDNLKPLMDQTLSSTQIKGLISEIVPEEKKEKFGTDDKTVFNYRLNKKDFEIVYTISGGVVKAVINRTIPAVAPPPPPPVQEIVPEPTNITPEPMEVLEVVEAVEQIEAAPVVAPPAPAAGEPEINALFRRMISDGASDLHLSSKTKPILRISGDLEEILDYPVITPDKMKELLFEIMPEQNKEEFDKQSDTDFAYEIKGLARFRCNAFMDRKGMGGVFRQIPMEILTAEQLGLSQAILDLCYLKKGLVVITGPTGSGKSTTLCAMIDYINKMRKLHVITIEDPIEFVHDNNKCLINQREVSVHTESFSNALRAALREDPDIVLVGEMRDLETVSIAIETAETGHLVFGTLHTSTAASTVDRIIDQFPTDRQEQIRTMLSSSLKGVVAQVLCKKEGGGRAAAMEVLIVNSAIANLIRDGKVFQIPSIMQTGRKMGMVLLNDALIKLVTDKVISPEEAYVNAMDKGSLHAIFRAKGIEVNLEGATEE